MGHLLPFSRFVAALSCHDGVGCSVVAALPTMSAAEGGRPLRGLPAHPPRRPHLPLLDAASARSPAPTVPAPLGGRPCGAPRASSARSSPAPARASPSSSRTWRWPPTSSPSLGKNLKLIIAVQGAIGKTPDRD
jgi:hypothetical protein